MSAGAVAQSPLPLPGAPQPAPAAQPAAPAPASQPAPAPKIDHAALVKKANDAVGLDIDAKIKGWRSELDRIDQGMHVQGAEHKTLNDLQKALFSVRSDTEAFWKKLEPVLNAANDDVRALPAAPAGGQEPEQAALYRAETTAYHDYVSSTQGAVDGTRNRIDTLINHLESIVRAKVTDELFRRSSAAFVPDNWNGAPGQILQLMTKARDVVTGWWDGQDQEEIYSIAGLALALWAALSVLSVRGVRWLRRWTDGGEPPFWRRASDAAGVICLRSLPAILPLILFYLAVDGYKAADGAGNLPDDAGWLLYSGFRSIIVVAVINALASAAISPRDHRWRLIPVSNAAAVRISALMLTVALLYAGATFLQTVAFLYKAPNSPRLALTMFPNTIIVLLVAAILLTPLRKERAEGMPQSSWLRFLRLPVWLIAIAIVASGATGYLAMSRFLAQQLVVTCSLLTIVYLFLLWADGAGQAIGSESSGIGRWLENTAKLDQGSRQRLSVPVSLLIKFTTLLAAIPLILNQWRFGWPTIFEWYRQFFFGFHIGNTEVSLAALLAFIIVFAIGYFAAKVFQQWLDMQVLKPAGLSGGLRDSIRTGVGYVGISAAALFALSYAGFSLSNLAIVAGALSVGIGFGMQSVVSNFVSGLILLAERPIKVGDLVVVGGEEGYVRKISVRSTEIETFDGANVLIPNSFFISEKVKNWTLRNNTGRIAIHVGVAHGSDPRQVKAILLQAAQAHPAVLRTPAPVVDFENIGGDALEFKLYAFVYDLNASMSARTDLRIAILDAFHAAGIAMASQQTDITLRDMDWLRDAVKLYVANTLDGHAAGNGSSAPVNRQTEPSG